MARAKKNKISLLNWMGTLLLCAVPGVNLIACICFMIFAKSPSKKSFALAMLLWMVILFAAVAALLWAMPDQMAEFAQFLREQTAAAPTVTPAP